jgi:hypothetical protein
MEKPKHSVSVAFPDPGPGAFLNLASGIRIRDLGWKKIQIQHPRSGISIPDLIFENLISVFWVKNYLNSLLRIRIRFLRSCQLWIRDKHPGSATLHSVISHDRFSGK